jgi:hypothetical protein
MARLMMKAFSIRGRWWRLEDAAYGRDLRRALRSMVKTTGLIGRRNWHRQKLRADTRGRDGSVRKSGVGSSADDKPSPQEPAPLSALVWAVIFCILLIAAVAIFALVLNR